MVLLPQNQTVSRIQLPIVTTNMETECTGLKMEFRETLSFIKLVLVKLVAQVLRLDENIQTTIQNGINGAFFLVNVGLYITKIKI